MLSSRSRLSCFVLLILAAAGIIRFSDAAGGEPGTQRPNILFIMTDQQHAGMIRCAGNTQLKTPALDGLAREGIRFERAYVANPVCVPSRISMATGVMPGRLGVFNNGMRAVVPDEVNANSLGKLIQRAGYDTFYGGKVHMCRELSPPNAGYDVVDRDPREALPEACIEFIRRSRDRPFFAVASFINPHDICFAHAAHIGKAPKAMRHVEELYRQASAMPLDQLPPLPANYAIPATEPQAIESHLSPKAVTPAGTMRKEYDPRQWRIYRWIYCRLTEQVDEHIGRILDAVRDAELEESTLILFTSDHGNMDGSHQLASKGLFYEESVRVPFSMKYKGVISAGRVDEQHLVATGLDILPTLCDYAGADVPDSLLGRSLRAIAEGRNVDDWRGYVVSENAWGRMVRSQRFKYCVYDSGTVRESLVDLTQDPGERINLAAEPASRDSLIAHRSYLQQWIEDSHDAEAKAFVIPPVTDVSVIEPAEERQQIELPDAVHEKCLSVLREGIRSDEFWPSIHAAEGLTLGGYGDEVRAALTPKLPNESDDQFRCGLLRELVRAGERNRVAGMLDILAGPDPHGHVHAAESLFKVGEIGDGSAMRAAMTQTDNPKLRLMAAAALARCGSDRALPVVREALNSKDEDLGRIAAWVLGRVGENEDIQRLRAKLDDVTQPLVRAFFQHSLAALGDAAGIAELANNLDSEDPLVRTMAATFAGDARATAVTPKLIAQLDDDQLDARIRAAQTLLVLSKPPPPDRNRDVSSLVFEATERNPRYTEGSIIELADGALLFAVTEFQDSGSDFAKAHIVARTTRNGGRSWSDSRILQENTGARNVMSVTLRRLGPAHRLDAPIGMFYLVKNGFDDLDVYLRVSRDDGASFEAPIQVTNQPGYHVMNNDRVTRLSSGRLLVPVAYTEDVKRVNHFVSYCYISDDDGGTWCRGTQHLDQPRRGAMEPEVVELRDGRVLMIVRTQLGKIAASHSTDGGDTWGEPFTLDVQAPEVPATLRRIPATGDLLLIWNHTYVAGSGHGGRRTPLTAAISRDEGKTWQNVRDLETREDQTYSYASLVFVGTRAVLSYWEQDAGSGRLSTRFRSLPVSWFY